MEHPFAGRAAIIASVVLAVAGSMVWFRPVVAMDEAMAPSVRTGDLSLTVPVPVADLNEGDLVVRPSVGGPGWIVSRVLEVDPLEGNIVHTQVDSSMTPDVPWVVDHRVRRLTAVIPGVGGFVSLVSPSLARGVMWLAAVTLAALAWRYRDERPVTW